MGIWKKILIICGVIIFLAIVAVGSIYAYFYSQGKMYAIQLPLTGAIVRLGKVPPSSFAAIQSSFAKYVTRAGQIVYDPLYVDDMIIDSEDNGDMWAHDIRTGQRKLYHWTLDTAYVCVDPRLIQIGSASAQIKPDPKEALANFHFFFTENGKRGDLDRSGFYHFEADALPGTPVKLILQSRTPESDGGFNVIGIFLFTNNIDCASGPV